MNIDFASSDWFDQYVQYRSAHPPELNTLIPLAREVKHGVEERFQSLRHPFYLVLQQSGLIYGFPVHYPFGTPDAGQVNRLPVRRRAKVILLDIMLHARLIEKGMPTGETYGRAVAQVAKRIRAYYHCLHVYGQGKAPEFIESVLLQRVRYRKRYFDVRRSGINSHLFWDLYFFLEYCRAAETPGFQAEPYFQTMVGRKKALKQLTLSLLAAAAHADQRITRQEKRLYRHFEQSSRLLTPNEKKAVKGLFEKGVRLKDIAFPENLDWLARRFLLDISLLAVHADADTDRLETAFLQRLLKKLNLGEEDLLASEADLGSFLYQYGKKLHFFHAREVGLQLMARAVMDNFMRLAGAAKMEYVETREMAATFSRLLARQLRLNQRNDLPSEAEIQAAFAQLRDIPKFLPFFSFIFMPVPGITEMYILLAFSLERFSGGSISLLPSQLRKVMGKGEEEE